MERKLMMALLVVSLAAGTMTGCGAAKEAEVAAETAKEEQDYGKALEWYEKAAELGHETAKKNAEDTRQKIK